MTTTIAPQQFSLDTPEGPALWTISRAAEPTGTVLALGHGAGGQITAKDLVAIAHLLPGRGVHVARFTQPWKVAGRKITAGPAVLDRGWNSAVSRLLTHLGADRLVSGGRSNGARVACRTQAESGAIGVVCLAFPLHPPGQPAKSRAEELLASSAPTLVVQGSSDPYGSPDELAAVLPAGSPVRVLPVEGAGHGLARHAWVAEQVAEFVDGL
ncbi:alpha/beta hydrolase family protein [Aestuariimicrobium soli]|uniref:alpha/beta hydrolase family protein n=1 Tax=Aestuariimicrobium soli TaxID=2035834 RepID=UPI003EBB6ED5